MSAVGPGSLVRCVEPTPPNSREPDLFARGGIYTVHSVHPNGGLILVEVPIPKGWSSFHEDRFIPIDDGAIDIFRRIAAPKKDKVQA